MDTLPPDVRAVIVRQLAAALAAAWRRQDSDTRPAGQGRTCAVQLKGEKPVEKNTLTERDHRLKADVRDIGIEVADNEHALLERVVSLNADVEP